MQSISRAFKLQITYIAAVVTLLAVGCGGGSGMNSGVSPRQEPVSIQANTSTQNSVAAPGPVPTAPQARPTAQSVPTSEGLKKVMLSLQDFPSGWSVQPDEADEDDDPACSIEPKRRAKPLAEGQVGFSKGTFGPFLFQELSVYAPGEGKQVWDKVIGSLRTCTEFVDKNDDGTTSITQISPMSFDKLGDETYAIRGKAKDATFLGLIEMHVVFVRKADVIMTMLLINVGFSSPDPDFTATMARKAIGKLS
jgi:hypothetical protein